MKSNDIHIRAISQEMPQPWITKISLKVTCLKFNSNYPGANELAIWCWNQTILGNPGQHLGCWCPGVTISPAAILLIMWDYKHPLYFDVKDWYLQQMGISQFQMRPHWVCNHFIPQESQVSGLILGLRPANERRRYKVTLSHCSHPNKEVARSCMCPYGDRKDGYIKHNSTCTGGDL